MVVTPEAGANPLPWWQAARGLIGRRVLTATRPVPVVLRPGPVFKEPSALVLDHAAALVDWQSWCQANAGSHCQLALSAHWLLSLAAPAEQVASSWEHYFGISPTVLAEQWLVRSVAGHNGVSLVCAVPRSLVDDLQAAARAHGVKVTWMGPWWAPEVQTWLAQADQPEHWEAREPGLVTHLKRQASAIASQDVTLSQVWTEVLDAPGVETNADVPAPDRLIASPPQKPIDAPLVEALDFVGPRVRTAVWSWGLLVAGLVAALSVADQAQQTQESLDEATQTLGRLERARHQQQVARTAPRAAREASASASSVLTAPALRQASSMVQLLAFPWTEVIGHVEQAASNEQAVLTSFSLDLSTLEGKAGAHPSARLTLAVRDDASALRWLATQGEGAQLLSRQLLSTPFDTSNGHYALRYDAAWSVDAAAWRGRP
ncbi:MAG: hypothetical protein EOP36_13440 [Rubrivivax sp.]|nr:MAG: hypothetical protein EOP36_13440 [Rubrivivax sp.]